MGEGIDLRDPALPTRLPDAFGTLRETDPVWSVTDGTWLVTRYEDVARLLKDRERCDTDIHDRRGYDTDRPFGAGSAMEIYQHGLLVNQGGTHHRHHRAVFTEPFTRANVEREMTAVVARHAERLIAALPNDGEVDWVAEVARPMPLSVFAELFALPAEDTAWIFERVHEDSVAFDVLLDPALVPDTDIKRGERAMLELRSYLSDLAGQRRDEPGADLLSVMIVSTAERGDLIWDDGLSQSMEALTAGTGTTQALLNGMIEAFSGHPAQWRRVAADPDLLRPAVEEALRYVSPALAMGRIAKEDFELRGQPIRAGDVLQCGLLAANRDPRAFPEPDRLDVARSPNRHVAFGGGVHTCVGSHLAKLEAREILSRALRRWSRIEVDTSAIAMEPMLMLRTYSELPVRLVGR